MTTILKVGGSLITEKTGRQALAHDRLAQVSTAIADAETSDLVLVHGGGSFGHRAAESHGITTETGTTDARAVRAVMDAMDRLNRAVLDALHDVGIPAVGLPPRSMAQKSGSGALDLFHPPVATFLHEGMLPVLYGDIVGHVDRGATVVSGDQLAITLFEELEADRVGFCTGVPGVLDDEGSVIPQISTMDEVHDTLGEPDGADVSGGMGAKIEALLGVDGPGAIFGIGELDAFFDGALPGTVVGDAETDPF